MPEIEASEKRQGLHLAGFRSAAVESKENFLAGTPKMPAKCESQVSDLRGCERSSVRLVPAEKFLKDLLVGGFCCETCQG